MRRLILNLIFLFICAGRLIAADPEADQFRAAASAFNDKFYERADQQLNEFVTKFPNSTNLAPALLMQAQARILQKKYDSGLELLKASEGNAGALLDQFLFWEGEALFQKGDFPAASQTYARLLHDAPQSGLALQAAFSEADALFQAKDYNGVIARLKEPKGSFATLSAGVTNNVFAFRGDLLLAESLLATGKFDEAKAGALAAGTIQGRPDLEWEKFQLLARIEAAGAKPDLALSYITNAVTAASSAGKPLLQAESLNLEADLFRKLNRTNDAIGSYERIATLPNLSIDQKRLAVLKQLELFTSNGAITNAIGRVEAYLANSTNEPAADLLRVKASDLWLQQFRSIATRNNGGAPERTRATNAIERARAHANFVLTQFTNSVHLGKAWLNVGWSYWEEGTLLQDNSKIAESENAFRNAIAQLTRSDDQALARFKLADAEFTLGQYANSITNYLAVIQQYGDLPQVRNSLFEQSYRKLVRASLALKDFTQAATYLEAFRKAFPASPLMEDTIYFFAQSLAQNNQPAQARQVLEQFQKDFPQSALIPEVKFAEARTYISEGNWAGALAKDLQWLATYTNNELRAEVEFQKANLYDKTGQRTNAYTSFTNFVATYPLHRLAPAAQNWVADYYYSDQEWPLAEQNYQKIFQNTNWTGSPLFYESRLMAAKTAFFRQAYSDAKAYLTNIISTPAAPTNIVVQALFELGDVTIEEPITGTTNKLNNYTQASIIFDRIARKYPNDLLAPLAWGKKGDCHLHLYPAYAQSFEAASNAYSMVLQLGNDQTPVAVLNQAEYGLGLLNEKAADQRQGAEKTAFLKAALTHYLNVVYGANLKGRQPSQLYLKLAGRDAGRLAEALNETSAALDLYKRLSQELPSMRQVWESRIATLQQKVASNP